MSALWAVTCFFNPAGYRRRVQNYHWFRQRLAMPLVTVELSFTAEFALRPGDADVLVQLDRGDMLFQKERLLNIALEHLPGDCKAVAWIDCDVIFPSNDWATRTLEALEHYAMVQPFSERYDLLPASRPEDIATWKRPYDRLSLMAVIAGNRLTAADFDQVKPPLGRPAWGLVWAARKDVLDRHGFYDACVFTSGDVAMFAAGFGAMNGPFMWDRMNIQSHRHYLAWAEPFYRTVRGSVGHVEGPVFHLWHGTIEARRYARCLRELRDLGFDPFTDIAMTEQGTWRWASDKPQLHAHVRDYFWLRNEDTGDQQAETVQPSDPAVLHLVAYRVLPYPGGLQESVMRIGASLAESGYRVIVYTLDQPADYRRPHPSHEGLKVVHLGGREALLEPYRGQENPDLTATETSRVTALLLENAVREEIGNCPGGRHAIISFYASGTGFLAQMVATTLGVPHIASVRGTDFELEVFGARQHARLRTTIEAAAQVVTTNEEQATGLSRIFKPRRPIRTIQNALPDACSRPLWQAPPGETVSLLSDCGFSGRKATHLLLRAVASLVDRGLPVSLTVLGSEFWLESQAYWVECKRRYESQYPNRFSFPGQATHEELDRCLLSSHIYCSASLAEGSSMSRIRALTLGIPIVTTANGGLPLLVYGCRHVRLCRPGDWEALARELEAAVEGIREGTLQPDLNYVERWRRHFRIERERDQWISAIEAAFVQ